MRNRKSIPRKKTVFKRAGTPSSASDYVEAKRQHMKRQRLQQRNSSKPRPTRATSSKMHFWHKNQKTKQTVAEETRAIVLGDGKYVEERRVSPVTSSLSLSARIAHTPNSPVSGADTTQVVQVPHDIAVTIELSRQSTTFYPHYSEALASAPPIPTSPLWVYSPSPLPSAPVAGSVQGGDEQEDKIARHSSLLASLSSPAAQPFYQEHKKFLKEDGSGLHDHSMVYSPGVVVFRREGDDDLPPDSNVDIVSASPTVNEGVGGEFIPPYFVNVISAVPVNAMAVRAKHVILPEERGLFENGIRSAMKERMSRILYLFEERGNRALVLGAFGCGPPNQNNVEAIASIWAELLVCGDLEGPGGTKREARFKNSFEKVVFAVPGKIVEQFRQTFKARLFEAEVADAAMDNS
ncbi:hypothetical protein EVJ58_g10405 [Rhodofomes roseus]|uniref:Microbial-type PARG catalytic domain-containing protein n=1 Tax=Rhodofomes roseus TaxID=34475 RepID=A0A4Y9XPR6_9APHY|nr:hypothetical protein EVJ58_g10405 [Rhodofomes roseus]